MKTGTNSQTTEEWKLAQMLQFGNIYTQTISSNPFSRNLSKKSMWNSIYKDTYFNSIKSFQN